MNERKVEIAVGVMFFGAMTLLAYFTILIKDEFISGRESYHMSADFPSGNGIKRNEIVKVLGVNAGIVEDVKLINNQVIVYMKMNAAFTLYENYSVTIRSDGIMGGKYVDIFPGNATDTKRFYKEIGKNETLKGTESKDLMAALEDLIDINKEGITETVANVREASGSIRDLSAKLNLTADKINRGEGTIGKLLTDDKIANQANDVLTDARETLEDAREQAPVTSFIRAALSIF